MSTETIKKKISVWISVRKLPSVNLPLGTTHLKHWEMIVFLQRNILLLTSDQSKPICLKGNYLEDVFDKTWYTTLT